MSAATGKVVVNRAMSLDGFIAGPGDEMGWIRDLAPQDDIAKELAFEQVGRYARGEPLINVVTDGY